MACLAGHASTEHCSTPFHPSPTPNKELAMLKPTLSFDPLIMIAFTLMLYAIVAILSWIRTRDWSKCSVVVGQYMLHVQIVAYIPVVTLYRGYRHGYDGELLGDVMVWCKDFGYIHHPTREELVFPTVEGIIPRPCTAVDMYDYEAR
jgi:hypothetical protein